jgi:DNA-binding transcriptional MerR regulator
LLTITHRNATNLPKPPNELRQRVEDAIKSCIDEDKQEVSRQIEEIGRARMRLTEKQIREALQDINLTRPGSS